LRKKYLLQVSNNGSSLTFQMVAKSRSLDKHEENSDGTERSDPLYM
jgi:hypothetical protein